MNRQFEIKNSMEKEKLILITGTAGFIGFHLAKLFLSNNWTVLGIDGMTDYYDVELKNHRHQILSKSKKFIKYEFFLQDLNKLVQVVKKYKPLIVIHLAAQAGVRYSLENPREYLNSNIVSTFNLLEVLKTIKIKHFLISSTSSVYGNNDNQPFKEILATDHPISIYAATKKSCEILCHSYSHLFNIPTTIFRFFTVYGPWGRPDMALFKFTRKILNDEKIDIYNYGDLERDFTYIDDLVDAIYKLVSISPAKDLQNKIVDDSLSNLAPYRIVNIGNSKPINLLKYIEVLEKTLGIKAKKNLIENQVGDVKSTWSDIGLIKSLVHFYPKTSIEIGIKKFIDWYKDYYKLKT